MVIFDYKGLAKNNLLSTTPQNSLWFHAELGIVRSHYFVPLGFVDCEHLHTLPHELVDCLLNKFYLSLNSLTRRRCVV